VSLAEICFTGHTDFVFVLSIVTNSGLPSINPFRLHGNIVKISRV
jgi:hypothetical protein